MTRKQVMFNSWYGDIEKRMSILNDNCKYKCSHCGSRAFIVGKKDKVICRNCGKWIFKTKQDEFKYRLNLTLSR